MLKILCSRILIAITGIVLSGAVLAAEPVTRMKLQTGVPSASIYFELMKNFADRAERMSNGRLKIEVLPDGAVVGFFGIADAVDKGVVDAGFAWTHFWSGKIAPQHFSLILQLGQVLVLTKSPIWRGFGMAVATSCMNGFTPTLLK